MSSYFMSFWLILFLSVILLTVILLNVTLPNHILLPSFCLMPLSWMQFCLMSFCKVSFFSRSVWSFYTLESNNFIQLALSIKGTLCFKQGDIQCDGLVFVNGDIDVNTRGNYFLRSVPSLTSSCLATQFQ